MPDAKQAWAAALCLGLGCTQHGEPPQDRDPDLDQDAPDTIISPARPATLEELIEETPAEPMARGPITPLSCKPFVGALGRLDADARPDLVVLCHAQDGASLVVLSGAPGGHFTERAPVSVRGSGLALGDLDDDGDLDLLLLDASSKPAYQVGLNDGDGHFELLARRSIPGRYGGELHGASLADLDGDGKLDAVVPLWDSIRVMPGSGDGIFSSGYALALGRDPYDTALGDLDGDGLLDLVATTQAAPARDRDHYDSAGAAVWIWRGQGRRFAKQPVTIEVSGAKQVELADLDGDGRLDIGVSGAGGLTVILDPLGAEPRSARTRVGTDGTLLAADVIDSPTPAELITSSYIQSRVHLMWAPASLPTALDKISIEAGSYSVGLYAADLDADGGRADLIVLDAGLPSTLADAPGPAVEVLFSH